MLSNIYGNMNMIKNAIAIH